MEKNMTSDMDTVFPRAFCGGYEKSSVIPSSFYPGNYGIIVY